MKRESSSSGARGAVHAVQRNPSRIESGFRCTDVSAVNGDGIRMSSVSNKSCVRVRGCTSSSSLFLEYSRSGNSRSSRSLRSGVEVESLPSGYGESTQSVLEWGDAGRNVLLCNEVEESLEGGVEGREGSSRSNSSSSFETRGQVEVRARGQAGS